MIIQICGPGGASFSLPAFPKTSAAVPTASRTIPPVVSPRLDLRACRGSGLLRYGGEVLLRFREGGLDAQGGLELCRCLGAGAPPSIAGARGCDGSRHHGRHA
jgi:hypothetical protein